MKEGESRGWISPHGRMWQFFLQMDFRGLGAGVGMLRCTGGG